MSSTEERSMFLGESDQGLQPPWEDEPTLPSSAPVTQSQHSATLRLIADLKEIVRKLQIEMAQHQANGLPPAPAPNRTGDTLASGKHAGKTREWCVAEAPDYVVFLADSGWATSRWGFSEEQIERARANPKLAALQRARR